MLTRHPVAVVPPHVTVVTGYGGRWNKRKAEAMSNADAAMSTMAHRRPHFHESEQVRPTFESPRPLPCHPLRLNLALSLLLRWLILARFPQMMGGGATTSCHHICAFFGEFGFTVQFVLAVLSFSALIFKRFQVRNTLLSSSPPVVACFSQTARHARRRRRGDQSKYSGSTR